MLKFISLYIIAAASMVHSQNEPAQRQLVDFKKKTEGPIGKMSTSAGAPVGYKEATYSLNTNLLTNENLLDVITHLTRERIPERFTHAKGAGAFGYFELTDDICDVCKAKMFCGVGKRTRVACRFSPAVIERGGVETLRDIRGFAVKFYTEEGNFDIVGLNTPMFAIRDPVYFASLFHSQKRNPRTNVFDKNMFWDYLTLRPESLFILLLLLGDRGIPDGYRHMPGYSIHTYEVYNEKGVKSWIRFHFEPEAGIKNLNSTEGAKLAGMDGDYATRDLYNAIANGKYPSWRVSLQIISEEDKKKANFDIHDITRILPQDIFPLRLVGRLVLTQNPLNYFAEVEQLAYSPANLIPGILGSPDKLFELRRLAYRDAQNYRLGVNYNEIPVNCPIHKPLTYNRDGVPPIRDNGKDAPNYFPNSFHGAEPYEKIKPSLTQIFEKEPYNLDQVKDYYKKLNSGERKRLIENTVGTLCPATSFLKERAIELFKSVDIELATKVAVGVASLKQCPVP